MAARTSVWRRLAKVLGCALSLLLIASTFPARLLAQTPPAAESTSAVYEELIEDAIREYRARHFPEARSLFARAHEAFPNARALRGIGMTEFELRNYPEAVRRLRSALEHHVKALEGALREETVILLARAESFVAELEIRATPAPASVIVDGVPIQLGPDNTLMLEVGDHLLEFEAVGYAVQRRRFSVRGGERQTLRVVFLRQPLAAERRPMRDHELGTTAQPHRPADHAPPPIERGLVGNVWLWTSVGIAAAALGAGLGFGLTGRSPPVDAPIVRNPIATGVGP